MNKNSDELKRSISNLEQYVCTLYETKDQLRDHIFKRAEQAFRAGEAAREDITTMDQLVERQQQVKTAFSKAIGMEEVPPQAQQIPPTTVVTSKTANDYYTVEKLLIEVRPNEWMTSLLYKPKCMKEETATSYPAVLFLSGHAYDAKHSDRYHQVCLRFVQAGMIVLAIDPLGQGERIAGLTDEAGHPVWGTGEHQRLGVQSYAMGHSIARYFVEDAQRAVDYLISRADVDPAQIAVTGNSGGGTQTAMMMLTDDRIAAAAPATFIMNREQYMLAGGVQDAEQIWPGFTAGGFDHEDILLAFAPKPLMVCAVEYDFFPIEATELTVQNSRKYWKLFDQSQCLQLATDQSIHCYTDYLACQAAAFFVKQFQSEHLLTEPLLSSFANAELDPLPEMTREQLLVKSKEINIDDASQITDELKAVAERMKEKHRNRSLDDQALDEQRLIHWLRQRTIEHAAREPVPFKPRFVKVDTIGAIEVSYCMWWSQANILNSGYLFHNNSSSSGDSSSAIAVAVWPRGTTSLQQYWSWIEEQTASGRTVLVLNVSGEGPHEPHPLYNRANYRFFGKMHKLTDELLWLDDSMAAIRVYDVIRAVQFVREYVVKNQEQEVILYGCGLFELYTLLAAVLIPVSHRTLALSTTTMKDWINSGIAQEEDVMSVVFPSILKYTDVAQLPERVGEKQ